MRKRARFGRQRPGIECLESRNLMAGDVTVAVTDEGGLSISGDDQANSISIEAGENPGEYVVTGHPTEDGDTTINSGASFTTAGVTRGIRIRMGDGADTVRGSGFRVNGGLGISMGPGDDSVELSEVGVRNSLRVGLGEGEDSLSLTDVRVRGRGTIRGGEGPDSVQIQDSAFAHRVGISTGAESDTVNIENSAARALLIAAGPGDNRIALTDTNVARLVTIVTGDGNDEISSINTAPQPADDTTEGQRPTRWGGARILDRGGENTINLANLGVGRAGLRIRTGEGVDTASLENVHVRGRTWLHTGAEADNLEILDSVFARGVRLQMGAGDDVLRIAESAFRGVTVLAGGPGVDTFFNEDNNFNGPLLENFELPDDGDEA